MSSRFVLLFLTFIIASASYGGFFEKWNFRDGTKFSAMATVEGTAIRPFVYRQLLPTTANLIERAVPQQLNQRFQDWLTQDPMRRNMIYRYFPNAKDSAKPEYALRYYALYAMTFVSLLLAIFAMRALSQTLYGDMPAATLAAYLMALLLPLLLTEGGFFYDMPELMFMALAVLLAIRGRVLMLAVTVALATYNKESFLLFVLTLYPFLRRHYSVKTTLGIQGMLLAIAFAINVAVKLYYAENPGDLVQTQLMSHIKWLLHPGAYLGFEVNYGVPTPKGFNVIHLLLLGLLIRSSWRHLGSDVRQHVWIAFTISVPLFLAFCYRGELRNLSMLYIALLLMLCISISRVLQHWYQGKAQIPLPSREAL